LFSGAPFERRANANQIPSLQYAICNRYRSRTCLCTTSLFAFRAVNPASLYVVKREVIEVTEVTAAAGTKQIAMLNPHVQLNVSPLPETQRVIHRLAQESFAKCINQADRHVRTPPAASHNFQFLHAARVACDKSNVRAENIEMKPSRW
jgi:hypothetical protein